MQPVSINISIIEDSEIIRENVVLFFQNSDEFSIVGNYRSVEDFIQSQTEGVPDVLLCDIGLPGMTGIEGIPHILKKFPAIKIIMLSVYEDEDRIFKALCAGAVGYLQKNATLEQIKTAALDVEHGGSAMSPGIARKVIAHFKPNQQEGETLTQRELQVVNCLVEGMSYKLIANRLNSSIDTVRSHIKNIYKKLHVNSKTEVISKFYRKEL